MDARRRGFLKTTALGAATTSLATALTTRSAHGAHARVRLALLGCGGRGTALAHEFSRLKHVEFTHVCDPDDRRSAGAARQLPNEPQPSRDPRVALDDAAVDAVVIATPDHWHAPAAILAADAGKHVYVEKPCSHNLREGRLLVEAARRHGCVIQHGTQSRSHDLILHAIRMLGEGAIGEVLAAKAWNVQQRDSIGHAAPTDPPTGFDYDLWLGPAPAVPFRSTCFHYNWHWWYDFGTGDMGNDGVHELDIARWGLGVESHPTRVAALGRKLVFEDDQQFPDTQYAVFDYPEDGRGGARQLVFEMRLWSRYGLEGSDNGNAFYGTQGWMLLSKRGTLKVFDERNRPKPIPEELPRVSSHAQNFLDAIRGDAAPRAEIHEGHLSASLCHLGNIAARTGRSLEFDPVREQIVNDGFAALLLRRQYRSGHWAVPEGV